MLNFQPSALIVAGITDTLGVCARVPDTGSVTPRADSAFAATDEAQNLSHVHQQLLTAARQAFPSAPVHPEAAAHRHTAPATMRRLTLIAALATTAVALEDWIRVWPKSGRQSRRLTSDLDCAPFDASHLVARPRRKRADCQFYDQPDKNDDGLLCIGDRFKIANEVSFCAEPYSPGSWYLAAKKGIDLGQGRRLGADPATFDYHPTNGY